MISTQESGRNRNRFQAIAKIAVFDIAGPLAAYSLLRSAGLSAVTALVVSGVLPAVGVTAGVIRHRRVDAIGVLVLAGIAVGTVVGLLSGNPRLVLIEGSVPTAVFGLLCLASLWSRRPLIYRFALEFIGADTPKGREFEALWRYPGFRHVFRLYTVVWGVAYLAEAAARVIIVETTSTGTALAVSKVMPYVVAALLVSWMVAYGRRAKREGERLAAEAQATVEAQVATVEAQATAAEAQATAAEAQATAAEAQASTVEAQATTVEAQATATAAREPAATAAR